MSRWHRLQLTSRFFKPAPAPPPSPPEPSFSLDYLAFPHILDRVLDYVIAARDSQTLHSLRLVCSEVRETIDKRVSKHLVVEGDRTYSRIGRITKDWSHAHPRVLDYHHFLRDASLVRPEVEILEAPQCAVEVVRIIDRGGNLDLGKPRIPPSVTLIHLGIPEFIWEVRDYRSSTFVLQDGVKRQVIRVGYHPVHGLLTNFGVTSEFKNYGINYTEQLEFVLILAPCDPLVAEPKRRLRTALARRTGSKRTLPQPGVPDLPPLSPNRSRSFLSNMILRIFKLLYLNRCFSVTVVGAETWEESWLSFPYKREEETPSEAGRPGWLRMWELDLRSIFSPPEVIHLRQGIRDRISFMALEEFQRAEPDLYELCVD